jgi:hypothetical protein
MREEIPIACSLSPADQATRGREFSALLDRGLLSREDTPRGIRLRFRRTPGLEQDVADLTRREKACCPFYDFHIEATSDQVILEVGAPDDARPVLDRLFDREAT